ncbi:tetratricopeptide repeat protein [Pasteurella skyensis]|uniref:tetratricopeptide repeat protein n=1 Tax=Phocoenobacter skyensis TaxID=97481 RepID=UPI00276E3BA4|nr:tetratricopeptide repeat protein [Pasteurella skyensis]MDP8176654.1 tetratricopeptide repeat protein [Pasteurella skyensis]MDP8199253.1 tetratricopeptide repeat protein [Pasteurella skyensis]
MREKLSQSKRFKIKQYLSTICLLFCFQVQANELSEMSLERLQDYCQKEYKHGCYETIYSRQKKDQQRMLEHLGKLCYLGMKKACIEGRKLKKQQYKPELPKVQATNGNLDAQYDLALFYLKKSKPLYSEALKWLNKAAENNSLIAQYELAYLYHFGRGVKQSFDKKMEWLKRAAEGGHSQAQYDLSKYYYTEESGVEANQKAFSWALKAAKQKYTEAEYLLGVYYLYGIGTNVNFDKAMEYFEKVKAKEYENVYHRLATLIKQCQGVRQCRCRCRSYPTTNYTKQQNLNLMQTTKNILNN